MSRHPGRYDYVLFVPALALACTGLVVVYSASAMLAREKLGGEFFFLARHSVYLVTGLFALLAFAHFPYSKLSKLAPLGVLMTFVLLLLVFTPMGVTRGGATRWLGIGPFTLQPSEIAKVALVLYLARYASRERNLASFSEGYVKPGIVAAMLVVPTLFQPDFGTSVILAATFLVVLYVAGTRAIYPLGIASLLVPVAGALVFTSEYRMKRVTGFLDPWNDMSNTGFQVIQSMLSFAGGGIAGRGLGEGKQKLFFLPEAHSDFVLSVVGEELGFAGVAAVLLCFAVIVWRGFGIALRQGDPFGRLVAFGLTFLLGLQAATNAGVVLGLLPPKGLTLPLVSYGGSSLLMTLASVGILMSVSAHTDLPVRTFASAADREPASTSGAWQIGSAAPPAGARRKAEGRGNA